MYENLYIPDCESASANTSPSTIYPVPDPLESEEQWDVYHHRDVRKMSALEVRCSHARLVMRLSGETHPHRWLIERLELLNLRIGHER